MVGIRGIQDIGPCMDTHMEEAGLDPRDARQIMITTKALCPTGLEYTKNIQVNTFLTGQSRNLL